MECSVNQCDRTSRKNGMCPGHDARVRRGQSVDGPLRAWSKHDATLAERVANHVEWEGDCLVWQGDVNSGGYGRFQVSGKMHYAHRVAFLDAGGTLSDEKPWVLHRCDNPPCVNPEHLFAGSRADNIRDMVAKGRGWQQKKTHCPQGHPYDEENTYVHEGHRHCRACKRKGRTPKTHCPHGHEYTDENSYIYKGVRSCRECGRQRGRSHYHKTKVRSS